MISLLIIDENAFLRLGLRTAIEMEEGIEVVGDARPGDATLNLIEDLRPDVALMSLRWPDMESVWVCREISEKFPSTRVVMLSDSEREEEIVLSALAGAAGYISKYTQGSDLALAIKVVAGGGTYFRAEIKEQVAARLRSVFGDQPPASAPEILSQAGGRHPEDGGRGLWQQGDRRKTETRSGDCEERRCSNPLQAGTGLAL